MSEERGTRRFTDVRMRGFGPRASVEAVLALLAARVGPLAPEPVPLVDAAGRVLAAAVTAPTDVPAFAKSAMDGFAVRTAAAAVPLRVVGAAFPARPFAGTVGAGEAVRITTGAPVPAGADAVLMAELASLDAEGRVVAREPVAPGKHVVRVGEDVAKEREILPAGRVLRPQDVGLLAAVGVAQVPAVRRPRVAILVTGNELLPPGSPPEGYRIADSNSPMLAALAVRDGGVVRPARYAPDDPDAIRAAIRDATNAADVVLISGGTSVGTEDHVPAAVAEVGELAVHGVALRPAGPTGAGFVGAAVVFLLPGNPASCLCAYDLFAGRAVRRLGGRPWELPYRTEVLPLGARIASETGRTDYVRVRCAGGSAVPVGGGAASLSGSVEADGFVLVPPDRDALPAGEEVVVWRFDG